MRGMAWLRAHSCVGRGAKTTTQSQFGACLGRDEVGDGDSRRHPPSLVVVANGDRVRGRVCGSIAGDPVVASPLGRRSGMSHTWRRLGEFRTGMPSGFPRRIPGGSGGFEPREGAPGVRGQRCEEEGPGCGFYPSATLMPRRRAVGLPGLETSEGDNLAPGRRSGANS